MSVDSQVDRTREINEKFVYNNDIATQKRVTGRR